MRQWYCFRKRGAIAGRRPARVWRPDSILFTFCHPEWSEAPAERSRRTLRPPATSSGTPTFSNRVRVFYRCSEVPKKARAFVDLLSSKYRRVYRCHPERSEAPAERSRRTLRPPATSSGTPTFSNRVRVSYRCSEGPKKARAFVDLLIPTCHLLYRCHPERSEAPAERSRRTLRPPATSSGTPTFSNRVRVFYRCSEVPKKARAFVDLL